MTRQIFNIFPTTIYVSEIPNHKKYKDIFYKVYPKYDYEQVTYQDGEEWFNTTSENAGNPLIHLEQSLSGLFEQIIDDVKIYTLDVLIFPAGYTHTHRGNPPIGGSKYLITSWAMVQDND